MDKSQVTSSSMYPHVRRGKLLKALFALSGCYGLFVITQNGFTPDVIPDKSSELINVAIICANDAGDLNGDLTLIENFFLLLHSIFGVSTGTRIHFDIIVYEHDKRHIEGELEKLLKTARALNKKVSHTIVSLDFIKKAYASDLHRLQHYYGKRNDNESFPIHRLIRPLYHKIFEYSKIISLEAIAEFRVDIWDLWLNFYSMKKYQLIGATYEQSPHYKIAFKQFRKNNPRTEVGSHPPGYPGFSVPVMLLDLEKMRNSKEYAESLLEPLSEQWQKKYYLDTGLGDQDFFTLLGAEIPYLFHILDCAWNKQTDPRLFSDEDFYLYHMCWNTPKVYSGPKIPVE